jgi:hypothetical protein
MNFIQAKDIQFLPFFTDVVEVTESTSIPVSGLVNSWVAHNQGDVWAFVNRKLLKGYPLGHPELDGGAWGDNGNWGEIYTGRINVVFDPSKVVGSSIQLVYVIIKYYALE